MSTHQQTTQRLLLRWKERNQMLHSITRERYFKTDEAREKYVAKLAKSADFLEVIFRSPIQDETTCGVDPTGTDA